MPVDLARELAARDVEVSGGIIAGALAYRLFIWLLPFGLVLVAGLGIAADAAERSPTSAARTLGLAGLVSTSIASAAKSSSRWYALAVGLPVLVLATQSLLRAFVGAHRLVWRDADTPAPRSKPSAVLRLLGLLVCFFVLSGLASFVRAYSVGLGVLVTLALPAAYAGLWLLVSVRLPHRGVPWRALVPGAVAVGVGATVLHGLAAYVIAPWGLAKEGTYGALGIASALLLGLFMLSRLFVAGAALNATLWERRGRRRRLRAA